MLKGLIIFICGGIVGGAATYFYADRKLEKKWMKISEEKEKSHADYIKDLQARAHAEDIARSQGYSSDSETKSSDKNTETEKPVRRNYTTYWQSRAEAEHPRDDEAEYNPNEDLNDPKLRNREPVIISHDEYWGDEYEHHDKLALYYYVEDDVLATEDGDVIDNIILNVGDALTKYGFKTNDEDVIYVRNFKLAVDYEIAKVYGSYEDDR